jgi:FAD/FMN-containing dehydrogenase/Fe-S oxidoreductase
MVGRIHLDLLTRKLYATDASEYQELPLAVAFPESEADVRELILFGAKTRTPLIARTAGTSLAGQVVGEGIVVDCGRYLNKIASLDVQARRVRVQPGVVRNELNQFLLTHGLFFGPETSTANRAMIGGMVGNNSCGSNSLVYGSTRDHLVSVRGFLSDGSEVIFGPLNHKEFEQKCESKSETLERKVYRECRYLLSNRENRKLIEENFPKRSIPRRNTGYALDLLMDSMVFDTSSEKPFNLSRLIAGSEGTLFFGVEFELSCDPLPPSHAALVCAHFHQLDEALKAILHALPHNPYAVELIDRHILEATQRNHTQSANRFFLQGEPAAILVIELRSEAESDLQSSLQALVTALRSNGLGYAYPVLRGSDQEKVWELRRAGQGLMSNIPGDAKPREVVEDTAVDVRDLPSYISEFQSILQNKYRMDCVYYAHAGSGELHTRPLFNLKTKDGLLAFRGIATDIAALVKKYRGSLSGEHGDGRLRGEFIPFMVGGRCYEMMRRIKRAFDPHNILNPGKIIDAPPMDTSLRYGPGHPDPQVETVFDFSNTQGMLRAAEQCNGSGDCRKGASSGGVMCPSYMATRNEKDTTRARANILRHTLTAPLDALRPLANKDVKDVMDLCLSCKACKSECPSSVDIAKLKAESLQQWYDANGAPLRSRLIGDFNRTARIASKVPWAWNLIFGTPFLRRQLNRLVGFHPNRSIPLLQKETLASWHRSRKIASGSRKAFLFCDEFTNYQDVSVGQKAIMLLERLGYAVIIPNHMESARAWLSKGFLRKAREIALENVRRLAPLVSAESPLVGIEPSAILGFRDEYPDLVPPEFCEMARSLAKNALLFEEFIAREYKEKRIHSQSFCSTRKVIHLHGHCHQKALSSISPSVVALKIPENYSVQVIPSGCCGMAGSFGYENEHFEVSMKIGSLVLFPAVKKIDSCDLIAAPGTSCRHQIKDGTDRMALHPAEILFDALA